VLSFGGVAKVYDTWRDCTHAVSTGHAMDLSRSGDPRAGNWNIYDNGLVSIILSSIDGWDKSSGPLVLAV